MALDIAPTAIPDVLLVVPDRFGDARGWFSETWNRAAFAAAGIDLDFVQDNQSRSAPPFTLRGLHFQRPPHAQAKLVRVLRGRIRDVAVDLRGGSPTYGRHVAVELDAERGAQLLVPVGFAHGFVTLEPDVEVAYKVTDRYAPECDGGVAWNDPDLAVDWGVPIDRVVLSEKDARLPALAELGTIFDGGA